MRLQKQSGTELYIMNIMKVLAIEPYHGGSHQAFLEGWQMHSSHTWTGVSLPAYKWKWRMRHAPVTIARRIAELVSAGESWDVLLCSDMLNLPELKGLAPQICSLPAVTYFHENQLTYPVQPGRENQRDMHFAYTNFTTALSADAVWFNSAFHRDSFLPALRKLLTHMPDFGHAELVDELMSKSAIHPPPIDTPHVRKFRSPGPMRILWAARFEHDKNPEDLLAALRILTNRGCDFRLSVIGQQFADSPQAFKDIESEFAGKIDHWGYQNTRQEYQNVLAQADVVISTANHEFFGIAVVEAIAAGAYAILPRRLAYPEVLDLGKCPQNSEFFYGGNSEQLADRLYKLSQMLVAGGRFPAESLSRLQRSIQRFYWPTCAQAMDTALEQVKQNEIRSHAADKGKP